ncbi:UDP-N-acetylmuramoyl-tripeptide--D-alanyl-D-alanine ligase [Bifidobacterium vespertilionis]|uniref:UDP-N-acetylmuramoyl-tripeptide--D-alanyl-D-alanine ligase n=1 Tax=Bifidobacterium vespertilionis TaxID=2562524 RepID=A0A5J5E009_9BIFI|nr:UDP-N-acetylmuramoyl-tripeptide--D-alanyl-D-alanine ligase [Bifidobacterium vespertilionis]KAA8822129.1 UDP-N-acetylmuramoyl-tripeptide--D-alanyl-D-alanine ligase [Bifidobacterium vespertilionis]KAA8823310.1 UDP-N-acetylmuramoyl-tripeptide--D-alanyl-D-alanine ligase [Bifidobacterium vespertilionis]
MMPMSLAEIAEAVGGRLAGVPGDVGEAVATSAVSDSRQVRAGSVFVAIKGERVDGHDFVASVGDKGAAAAIVEHEVPGAAVPQIVVDNSVKALGALARHNIERRRASGEPFRIVGITGSVGKTTTKDLLKAMLAELGPTVAPVGSFNNEIGLPLTALKVGPATRYFVAEMGANHLGEIAYLTTIAPPDIAVVLKVGCAHLGEFGSVERIAQAKSEIVRGELPHGVTVLNADDVHVAAMKDIAPGDVVWFGRENDHDGRALALRALDVLHDELDHPFFELTDGKDTVPVHLAICGDHNVMNALAASTVAGMLGLPLDAIARVLEDQKHISPHRMAVSRVSREGADFTLIDDSFNANPDSMRAGLDGLAAWGASRAAQPHRVAVLGAMLELGADGDRLHHDIGAYAADLGLDVVIAVGSSSDASLDELAGRIADGAREAAEARAKAGKTAAKVLLVHSADEADKAVIADAADAQDPVVLLKGSHASGLSALAERWA